jgi:hypothetical protein
LVDIIKCRVQAPQVEAAYVLACDVAGGRTATSAGATGAGGGLSGAACAGGAGGELLDVAAEDVEGFAGGAVVGDYSEDRGAEFVCHGVVRCL